MKRTYTTAETAYDGFGTRTVKVVGATRNGKTVRLGETPAEHVDWQRMRYASGMNLSADETKWSEISDLILWDDDPCGDTRR